MTNQERISREIERMNEEREQQAQANIRQCLAGIVAQQALVKVAQAKIAELKKALADITVEPVLASDIVG